jgi:hypothetical protein
MSIVAEGYKSVGRYCSRHKGCCVLRTRVRMKCCHTTFIFCKWHQHLMSNRKLIQRSSHSWSKSRLHMGYVRLKDSKANWIRQLDSERHYSRNAQFQRRAFVWSSYLKCHFSGTIYVHSHTRTLVRAYTQMNASKTSLSNTGYHLHVSLRLCTFCCRFVISNVIFLSLISCFQVASTLPLRFIII